MDWLALHLALDICIVLFTQVTQIFSQLSSSLGSQPAFENICMHRESLAARHCCDSIPL